MEKAGGMDEFDDCGKRMAAFPPVAEKIGGDQHQQRPETLAAAAQEVADYLGNYCNFGAEMKFHFRFNTLQIRTITGKNILNLH
ncbi:MAG: hypothetical protein A4E66_02579 [Syntrophus sp. PtaB.Bin001]|nr:MAG: hypothetical protein A4E66_02579 [Syntrophus sp. PtaB.Bin001]